MDNDPVDINSNHPTEEHTRQMRERERKKEEGKKKRNTQRREEAKVADRATRMSWWPKG